MTIENTQITTLRFIEEWKTQDPKRLTAELISVNKETNRKPDVYHFGVENGLLIDPETQKPVLDFINPGVEYDVAEKLQSWASENNEGLAYWISPRNEQYPCEKIIIHRIAYTFKGKKVVLNSAILFDAELENPESLRETFFTREDNEENLFDILAWIEKVSGEKVETSSKQIGSRKQAEIFAEQIRNNVNPYLIIERMREVNFLGNNPISCPPSSGFIGFMLSRSPTVNLSESMKFVKNCPKCGAVINTFISKGYRCPNCGGIYEGC